MKAALFLFCLCMSLIVSAQHLDTESLDKFFDRIEQKGQGMGSFALAKGGQVIYARAFGYASVEDDIPATPETKYRIGSVSKTFTAVIILEMVNEGKLSLGTPLSQFFPELPKADEITIEQLLRHRSGIHNFGNDQSEKYRDINPQTKAEALEVFRQAKLDFKPGSKADYNNANYLLLSFIAEEVDQMPFAQVLERRVVEPLQLNNTYVDDTIAPAANEAYGYFGEREWIRTANGDAGFLLGISGIVSTPSDLATFYYAVLNRPFFSIDLLEEMKRLEDGMGMGLYRYPFGNEHLYGHAGNMGAFSSMAGCFHLKGVSFALCLNVERMPLNDILVEALQIYFGE